ncbi:MAG: ABC transporter permease, partial [bacterium]
GFYLTPILYPLSLITNVTFQKIILLNPMAQAIQAARYSIITHKTITIHEIFQGGYYQFIPYIIVVLVIVFGSFFFRQQSRNFAEDI